MKIKKWKLYFVLGVLLFPLFFINVKDSHDWGDDFAQYLIQARNIVESRPQTENGLLHNENDPAYAIKAYPVGMPLLLAPVYYFFQLSILPYCILFSAILILTGILIFEYFRKRTDVFTAMIISLLFCYNVNIVDLKKQILSEIPFTCLLLLFLVLPETKYYQKKYSWIVAGIILSLLISIRLAGIALIAGYIIYEFVEIAKMKEGKRILEGLKKMALTLLSSAIIFILLNGYLFPINPGGLFGFYTSAFQSHDIQFLNNADFYFLVSKYLFPFFGSWVFSSWILMAIAGWLLRFYKKPSICEYFFPFYVLLILYYPYSSAGLRFLFPLLPFLIYYSYYFISEIAGLINVSLKWIGTATIVVALAACINPLFGIISQQSLVEDGPQQKVSEELFSFLKSTPENAAIVFCKARAISLYTDRHTLYTTKNLEPEKIYEQFHHYNLLYLVIAKVTADNEIYDPTLLNYVDRYKINYRRVWENEHFDVYQQQ